MRNLAATVGAFLWLGAVAVAADVPTPQDIRDSLQLGNTVKAARQAQQALQTAASADAAGLRYLLLKAHVLDLQPQGGKLFKQTVGKEPDGMARYQERLDSMEAGLRGEGESLLPLLATLLDGGDGLDRLLVLGLLEEMVATADWNAASAEARGSVESAAGRAALSAASDCIGQETTRAGPRDPDGDPRQDDYFQSIYSLLSGLAFLSRADPAAAAGAAAAALECRGAAGWIVHDPQQLERLGPDLADPLRRMLENALRDEVKVDALLLLGRFGRCDDLEIVLKIQDEAQGVVARAADSAWRRMQHRLDCAG